MNTTENYSLSEDGKTLTINIERESQRGTSTGKMVFTKK
jgi:hypothetical protein